MRRVVVTGANVAGKTAFAERLSQARPGLPVIHFDALKLKQNWQQRDRPEIEERLRSVIAPEDWILEGGPRLLHLALPRAEALIWLDPPTRVRAWRLAQRPWTSLGQTRRELPDKNPDRLLQQYRFALRSLARTGAFRRTLASHVEAAGATRVWHCRTNTDTRAALSYVAGGATSRR